jgi:transposase
LGDALSERDRDRVRIKALSREPLAMRLRLRYPLASGPEGVTLEGRKMAMAGNRGVVYKTESMSTLLNNTNQLV